MAKKGDDFLAALQARKEQLRNGRATQSERPPTPEIETEQQVEGVRPAPTPASASEPNLQVQGLRPNLDPEPADPAAAWSECLTAARADAMRAGSSMRAAGGWSDLGGGRAASIEELESRLLTAPKQASAAAYAACEEIASTVLGKLEARVEAVSVSWVSAVDTEWAPFFAGTDAGDASRAAAELLSEALQPATDQAQSVVDEVDALAGRLATSHPDLADPWKALARDLRGWFAAIVDTADKTGQPGSAAHAHARACAWAHARLAAMSPEEYRCAKRESVIQHMAPADAAAARAADAAAEAEAKRKAEAAAAVAEWRTVVADLLGRYPLARSIIAEGHVSMAKMLQTAGLGRKSTTARKNPDGSTTKVVSEQLPVLVAIAETRDGVELEFDPLRGQSVATWQTALGVLSVELGLSTLTVEQRGRRLVVTTHDVAPPEMPTKLVENRPVPYDAVAGRSYLGQTETGEEAWITWAGNSGLVVGGTPGSGKTASMLPVFAGMAGHAELHIFDGKAGFDLEPLRSIARTFDNSGDIDGPLVDVLERVEQLRVTRSQALYTRTGISNFWNVPLQAREEMGLYPVVVVIDECQTWLDTSGMDKDERELGAVITKGVRQLIQKGRSAGIVVILTTQKPDAKSIPTVIRDNSGLRIAFKVTTREQGATVLGALPDGAPRPIDIPRSAKGRCITAAEDGGLDVVQTIYVTPHDITAALAGAPPVPDQLSVAKHLLAN